MQSMEPARILGDGAAPRNRHGEKKRIEPRIIEAFANEAPRGGAAREFLN
ncbi:MAG: hypothetical protein R3F19_22070 [Verrucomicrobiales bacterium]